MRDAPLLQAMLGYAARRRVSFHMPGHQDGACLPERVRMQLAEIDATELADTDDLNDPTGPAAEAMRAAADAFGAAETLFVTGGSTTAIQAMVTAFCPRGSLVIMPRTVHRSILNIAMLLGLRVAFLPHGLPPAQPAGAADIIGQPIAPPSPAGLRDALARHPDASAVLVTSPDYFGACPDLAALAAVAKSFGCPLLVDEAHGAHLCFAPSLLPPSALASGASACVQSAHKTLPALTQGAYLHRGHDTCLAQGRPWPGDGHLRQCLSLYQTSSPSLMIGSTLDYARSLMQASGESAVAATLERIARFRAKLSPVFRCLGQQADERPEKCDRDPLRLVIDGLETGLTGFEIAQQLSRQGIDVEMADLRRLVLIPGLFQAEDELTALADALNRIATGADAEPPMESRTATGADGEPRLESRSLALRIAEHRSLDAAFYGWLQTPPEPVAMPVSPLLAGLPVSWLPLSESAGQTAADAIIPYPPGMPLVWPGEKLSADRLALLQVLLENGFCLHGIFRKSENPGIRVLA